jgi:hypothetical protein
VLDNLTSFSFKEVKDQNLKMTETRVEADVEKEAIKTEFKKQVFILGLRIRIRIMLESRNRIRIKVKAQEL